MKGTNSAYSIPIANDSSHESLSGLSIPFHTSAPIPHGETNGNRPDFFESYKANDEVAEDLDPELKAKAKSLRAFSYKHDGHYPTPGGHGAKTHTYSQPEGEEVSVAVHKKGGSTHTVNSEKEMGSYLGKGKSPEHLHEGLRSVWKGRGNISPHVREVPGYEQVNSAQDSEGPTGKKFTESLHERRTDGTFEASSNKKKKDED